MLSPHTCECLLELGVALSPNEHTDVSAQQPAVVARLAARIEELAAGPDVHAPQWIPYLACDTPGRSCEQRPKLKNAAAEKKGCLDVFSFPGEVSP